MLTNPGLFCPAPPAHTAEVTCGRLQARVAAGPARQGDSPSGRRRALGRRRFPGDGAAGPRLETPSGPSGLASARLRGPREGFVGRAWSDTAAAAPRPPRPSPAACRCGPAIGRARRGGNGGGGGPGTAAGRARHAEALLPLRGGGPAPAENTRGAAGAQPRRARRGVPAGSLR